MLFFSLQINFNTKRGPWIHYEPLVLLFYRLCFFTAPFFIYLITPSLLLSSLFSIILYSNLHLFKSYKYMFAIYRASFMIIIIYFYLFAYVKYLLSLIMIIMLLLYLMIVNLFIIRSRFDIVVIMSLLLYHFSNYILIIKIDNLFIIFSMLDFLLLFIIIIFVN